MTIQRRKESGRTVRTVSQSCCLQGAFLFIFFNRGIAQRLLDLIFQGFNIHHLAHIVEVIAHEDDRSQEIIHCHFLLNGIPYALTVIDPSELLVVYV